MKKTILVGGYYGGGNLGDEAILASMLQEMRMRREDLSFIVTSWNPDETASRHHVKAIHWKNIPDLLDAGTQADLILLGGGGLFQDYWGMDPKTYLRKSAWGISEYGSLPLLSRVLGIPCMIYGVGVGPLQSDLAREHTRLAFERCQVATVRDSESLELLRQTGFDLQEGRGTRVEVCADPVFSLATTAKDDVWVERFLGGNKLTGEMLVAVNLRYWDRPGPLWVWLPYVADGLNAFLQKNPRIHAVLLPFQADPDNPYNDDAAVLKNLAPFLEDARRVHIMEQPPDAGNVQALLRRCQMVVGMRLHAAILGLNEAIPVVALAYDPKVAILMREFGLGDFCVDTLTPHPDAFAAVLQQAWEQRSNLSSSIRPQLMARRESARRSAELAMELLAMDRSAPNEFDRQFALHQLRLLFDADMELEQRSLEKRQLQEQLWEAQEQLREANEIIQKKDRDIHAVAAEKMQALQTLADEKTREYLALQAVLAERQARAIAEADALRGQIEMRDTRVLQLNSENSQLATQVALLTEQVDLLMGRLREIEASLFTKLARRYYRLAQSPPLRPIYTFLLRSKQRGLGKAVQQAVETAREQKATEPVRAVIPALNGRKLKGVFIVTSAFVFDQFYNQRVINLSKYLANQGWGVIYIAWRWSKDDPMNGIGEEVYPNIFQVPVDMFLENLADLETLQHARKYFVVEFPHPEFFKAAIKLRRYGFPIIYEIIDEWEEFHKAGQSPWFTLSMERAMVINANVLTAVSQPLVEKFADLREDIHLLPNGYDPKVLGSQYANVARADFKRPEIHLGYFGHLTDSWFDWDLILRVLDRAKERGTRLHFHLIGYGSPNLEERLADYNDRVTLYGRVQPEDLHQYARKWDAAIIPFRQGKLSQAVDPIKIYEYFFFGLPVIVTGINHLRSLPRVRVAKDEEEFLQAVEQFKLEAQGKQNIESRVGNDIDRVLAESTWEQRFTRLLELLERKEWMSL